MPSPEMQQVVANLAEEKAKAALLPDPSWAELREHYAELATSFLLTRPHR